MGCKLMNLGNGKWGATSRKTRYFRDPQGNITHSGDHDESFMNRTLEEVSEFLMQRGVDDNEIDTAIQEMIKHEHNVAEFGIYGRFVFSKFVGVLH